MLLEARIEEYEQGAWVADLVSSDPFLGTFSLPDGSSWVGTKVSESIDRGRYFTTAIGGKNGLGKTVQDQFYSGQVALQIAVQAICTQAGEVFGGAQTGVFMSQYQRLRGTVAETLDTMAEVFSQVWWIGREGTLQMQPLRSPAGNASGIQDMEQVDVDGSVELLQPRSCQIGALYGTVPKTIRHIRWRMTPERFSARLYFVPFVFRSPTSTKYSRLYSALVSQDNGDGTVDVIADSRFGVTKVKMLSGVPGSKIKVMPGEQVTLGFLGANPQNPFCFGTAQDATATKQVARNGDTVSVTLTPSNVAQILAPPGAGGGPCSSAGPIDVTGTVTSGSNRLKVGDA